jgi:hypothetical protein
MFTDYHLCGGANLLKTYKLAATVPNAGVPGIVTGTTGNVGIGTTTAFTDTVGLIVDTGTYTTVQATILANVNALVGTGEGLITVSIRPDLVVGALVTGAPTENTAMAILTNTSASAGGTVVTATVQSNSLDGGTIWCIGGNNVGYSRTITTHTSTTSLTVTVPFPRAIAVGDTFLAMPWNMADTGMDNIAASTLVTQADASIAVGTGGLATVVDQYLRGPTDTVIGFTLGDHVLKVNTI